MKGVLNMGLSFSGFNGIDTDTLITQLMYLEEAPLRRMEASKQDIQTQINAWQAVNTALDTFKTKANDLSDIFGNMASTVDNEDVITASSDSFASSGTYEIEVEQLYQAHTIASSSQVEAEDISGGFDIEVNGFSVTIDVSEASLHDIAEKINDATIEHDGDEIHLAQASVVDNRLVIQASSEVVGESANTDSVIDNRVVLSESTELDSILGTLNLIDTAENPIEIQDFQMAKFTVNGLAVERASNEGIDDVIKGVTLNLEGETGEKSTLRVGTDKEAMEEEVKAFVTQYNSLIDILGKYGTADEAQIESGSGVAVLSGDATLSTVESMMYNSVMTPSNTLSSADWLSNTPLSWNTGSEKNLVIDGITIALDGGDSLENIAEKINNNGEIDTKGITARIKDNRLVIESGSSQAVSLSGSDNVVLRDLQIPENFNNNMVSILGIEIDRYGKLSVDDEKLDEALGNNISDVKQMFAGVGGVIDRVETNVEMAIKSYSSSDGGYISNRINSLQNEIKYIDEDIENLGRRLDVREERLKAQFTQMDQLISQLNNQSSWLNNQISEF